MENRWDVRHDAQSGLCPASSVIISGSENYAKGNRSVTIELTPDDEEVLADLLLEWEDAQDSPVPKSAEVLCGPRRDLVDELNRRIDELRSMNRLMIDFTAKTRLMEPAEYDSINAPHCPTIAGFRVLGEIGRGGMGIVYKAIQLNLKRPVALKLINDMSQNPKMLVSRLRDEAEALGKLNHEHVIQVYDVRGGPRGHSIMC